MNKEEMYHEPAQNLQPYNRSLCSVLEDMRTSFENYNFSSFASLIEEAQIYANRMEAKLHDVKSYSEMKKKYKEMEEEVEEYNSKQIKGFIDE